MAEQKPTQVFAIRLRSKYTGEEIILGTQYPTQDAAIEAARIGVCDRCNTWTVFPVSKDSVWMDKRRGFVRLQR